MASLSIKTPIVYDSTDGFAMNKTLPELVRQNLKMLILTNPGERVMDPNFGVGINRYLFSNFSENYQARIRSKINEQNINFYIDFIVNSLFEANKYFNDQEPWKKKDNLIRLNTIVYTTLEIVRKISFLLYPIIPETSLKALKIFNLSEKDIKLETISNNEFIIKGNMINKIDILIKKIEKEDD